MEGGVEGVGGGVVGYPWFEKMDFQKGGKERIGECRQLPQPATRMRPPPPNSHLPKTVIEDTDSFTVIP